MRREDLEHLIRASAEVTGDTDIVIVGSQAILGSFERVPAAMLVSVEADVFPRSKVEKADNIDGALGEFSPFHAEHHIYAHLVGPETAKAPEGWQQRLVALHNANTGGATGWCLEPHDLILAKLVRGDEKDREFAVNALAYGLVDPNTLQERALRLPVEAARQDFVAGLLIAAISRAANTPAPGGKHTIALHAAVAADPEWVSSHERDGELVRGRWR